MRFVITLCLLLTFGQARQQPIPNDNKKKCDCAARLKSCLKFAKSKQAKKICQDDYKTCTETCVEEEL